MLEVLVCRIGLSQYQMYQAHKSQKQNNDIYNNSKEYNNNNK